MSLSAVETLFYPFASGLLEAPQAGQRVVFLNARNHGVLQEWGADIKAQQFFKPYADPLERAGFSVFQSCEGIGEGYDYALVLLTKNQIEASGLLARALKSVKPGGIVMAAADNKAGGARLPKMFKGFGLEDVRSESKHKARVVWAMRDAYDQQSIVQALEKASVRQLGGFETMPGIYGWDKVDRGSALLIEHLPENLSGDAADFGCGYGLLSRHIARAQAVRSLTCVDADWRAVQLCERNVEAPDKEFQFEWRDLTSMHYQRCFDAVVMNPPFHEGKNAAPVIGQDFIRHSAQALRAGGHLWMVANIQLPYEVTLRETFGSFEEKCVQDGFKILCAQK